MGLNEPSPVWIGLKLDSLNSMIFLDVAANLQLNSLKENTDYDALGCGIKHL